jgi:hypothetical protein
MTLGLINANPVVHAKKERVARTEDLHGDDAVDPLEIYDILFFFFSFSSVFPSKFSNFVPTVFDTTNLGSLTRIGKFREGYKRSGAPLLFGTAQRSFGGIDHR